VDTRNLKQTRSTQMAKMEKIELERHREQLTDDVKGLVDKYRSIFEWDVPEVDEVAVDRLILGAIRQALDGVEQSLPGPAKT
jgi:hypothetical protein